MELVKIVLDKKLRNYTDLSLFYMLLDENCNAQSYFELESCFRRKIEIYLKKLGVPDDLVMSDHLHCVEKLIDASLVKLLPELKNKISI